MTNRLAQKTIKKIFYGSKEKPAILLTLFLYVMIISISFVFLLPILTMLSEGLKNPRDLLNPLVRWIPSQLFFENFRRAWIVMGGMNTIVSSTLMFLAIAAAQTFSAAVVGYGFAKYPTKLITLLFGVMLMTFIIPEQVTMLPRYIMFRDYNMLKTFFPFLIPAVLGNGLKNAIFILIFYQFFRLTPKSLDEAAYVDGAGFFKVFLRINMALAAPAIIVVFVFSFVWHWNETYLAGMYFDTTIKTMPLLLERFTTNYENMFRAAGTSAEHMLRLNEAVRMSAVLITIAPLIVLYAIVEQKLVESIDRAGITGE